MTNPVNDQLRKHFQDVLRHVSDSDYREPEALFAAWQGLCEAEQHVARSLEYELAVELRAACDAEQVCIRSGNVLPRDGGDDSIHPRTDRAIQLARASQMFHLVHNVGHSDALVKAVDLGKGERFRVPGEDGVYTRYDLLSSDEFDTACYAVKDGERYVFRFIESEEVIRV